MKKRSILFLVFLVGLGLIISQCVKDEFVEPTSEMSLKKGGKSTPSVEAGNNLSFPVIWAEGITKTLPGTPGMDPVTDGEWWYQWGMNGVDPDVTPASCPPDPDESDLLLNPEGLSYCDDGIPGSLSEDHLAGQPEADNPLPLAKAFLQKDVNNTWQAESADWSGSPVNVTWIDWGDNLESVDWYTRSQVRTEVVLFQDLIDPMTEYQMRHTDGWGINEVHGLATSLVEEPLLGAGTQATVYSHCARLTIQKLLVDKDDPRLAYLEWVPEEGWIEPEYYPVTDESDPVPFTDDLINPHIFNGSVHEGGDGPGYYSAEINVKGRIIYGYTWNVRQLNDDEPVEGSVIPTPAGVYRITFSFDETCGGATLNTSFEEGITNILVPLEEEVTTEVIKAEAEDSGDTGGGTAVLDFENNLTYIDVTILERGGGGGGGGNKGGR